MLFLKETYISLIYLYDKLTCKYYLMIFFFFFPTTKCQCLEILHNHFTTFTLRRNNNFIVSLFLLF